MRWHAGQQQESCVGMPHVVKSHRREFGAGHLPVEALRHDVDILWPPVRAGEDLDQDLALGVAAATPPHIDGRTHVTTAREGPGC